MEILSIFYHVKIIIREARIGFTIEWQMPTIHGIDIFTKEDVSS
jgi:hypothetical protein